VRGTARTMLTEVKLDNFRIFGKEVIFRLRPITVLIGENSAGKSSFIKFLLMLQQSLAASEAGFLEPEGEKVHLGAFVDLRNSVAKRPFLGFQLKFRTGDIPPLVERKMLEAVQQGNLQLDPVTQRGELHIRVERVETLTQREADEAEYEVRAKVPYSSKRRSGFHAVKATLNGDPLFSQLSRNLRETQFLRFSFASTMETTESLKHFFTDRYLRPLRGEIRSWRHLSAIREESQRAIVTSSPPARDVGQMGEYAMPHLQRIINEGGEEARFVLRHMASVLEIENLRFESSMKGYLAHCYCTNSKTKAEVFLSDFGFGVSQCIPIFVQGALMRDQQLLLIEQPEAQLHPSAQIEMGTFFAELWKERRVMSIVETHSSQIILRLRRLIALGKLLAADVSIAYVYVDDQGVPSVKNLDVDSSGNLEKGLPMEFFGADVLESMKLGLKR